MKKSRTRQSTVRDFFSDRTRSSEKPGESSYDVAKTVPTSSFSWIVMEAGSDDTSEPSFQHP